MARIAVKHTCTEITLDSKSFPSMMTDVNTITAEKCLARLVSINLIDVGIDMRMNCVRVQALHHSQLPCCWICFHKKCLLVFAIIHILSLAMI